MKVVCIDNNDGNSRHLDLYEVYDVEPEESLFPDHYIIRKPNEYEYWIKKEKFITLDEWRKIKLDRII